MPKNVLPEAARVLPKAGQSVWLKAFNGALDKGLPEDEASKQAWEAVKRAGYERKAGGKWGKFMDNDFVLNDDGTFQLGVPLMKVNVQKRIVEGFATLNNVDEAGDKVDMDASQEAFNNWFGNIREMHQPQAVGKAIDFYPDTYIDPDTGKHYEGMWVRAKISKGAEDTWQKVLDGTLAGFSIGGATLEKNREMHKFEDGSERQVWNITKYRLTELSLVDNPCNRLATISLVKSVDGQPLVDDVVADGEFDKSYDGNAGTFVDLSDGIQGVVLALENWRDDAIRNNADSEVITASELLSSLRSRLRYERDEAEYHSRMNKSEDTTNTKEESTMDTEGTQELQENENSDTNGVETQAISDDDRNLLEKFVRFIKGNEANTDSGEESLEKTETKEELPEMEMEEVKKAIGEATEGLEESLTKSVDEKFGAVGESLVKITELLEKAATADAVEEVKTGLETQIATLTERVEAVEKGGALKKSEDDTEGADEVEDLTKSEGFWGGELLPEFMLGQKGA